MKRLKIFLFADTLYAGWLSLCPSLPKSQESRSLQGYSSWQTTTLRVALELISVMGRDSLCLRLHIYNNIKEVNVLSLSIRYTQICVGRVVLDVIHHFSIDTEDANLWHVSSSLHLDVCLNVESGVKRAHMQPLETLETLVSNF